MVYSAVRHVVHYEEGLLVGCVDAADEPKHSNSKAETPRGHTGVFGGGPLGMSLTPAGRAAVVIQVSSVVVQKKREAETSSLSSDKTVTLPSEKLGRPVGGQ